MRSNTAPRTSVGELPDPRAQRAQRPVRCTAPRPSYVITEVLDAQARTSGGERADPGLFFVSDPLRASASSGLRLGTGSASASR